MFTEAHRQELETKGFTVVEDVLDSSFCDGCVAQYREWLSKFSEKNEWPYSKNSLMQYYRTGYAEPSWRVRLAVKPIFSQLWGTEKLLSSVDAIAIGRPPETGKETFQKPGEHWLHVDQFPEQRGLHSYQGAVYLETADEDDWTFQVIEGSHRLLDEFLVGRDRYNTGKPMYKSFHLENSDPAWYEEKGCKTKRIPAKKGSVVLWDSRLVHANARPLEGRKHPDRWRFVVFVCMAPAIWAREEDFEKKVEAYNKLCLTKHRPSQSVGFFPESTPEDGYLNIPIVNEMPKIGLSDEAKKLCGVIRYDFEDGKPNGPNWSPKWKNDIIP